MSTRRSIGVLAAVALLAGSMVYVGDHVLERLVAGPRVDISPVEEPLSSGHRPSTYRDALRRLDLAAARELASDESQRHLAEALGRMMEADVEAGIVRLQPLLDETSDPWIASSAAEMLAGALRIARRWRALLALAERHPELVDTGALDEADLVLARALAAAPDERIQLPPEGTVVVGELLRGGLPALDVELEGRSWRFLLDTGASETVIGSHVAADAGIEPLGEEVGLGYTSTSHSIEFRPALAGSLVLGELRVENHPLVIVDETELEFRALGLVLLKIDGVLGWPLLRDVTVEIDYREGGARFLPSPRSSARARNLVWLGYPAVRLRSRSGGSLLFGLDTGAVSTGVRAHTLARLGAGPAREVGDLAVGAGGSQAVEVQTLEDVTLHLAGWALRFSSISTTQGVRGAILWRPDGRLGSDVARGRRLYIDVGSGRVELRP